MYLAGDTFNWIAGSGSQNFRPKTTEELNETIYLKDQIRPPRIVQVTLEKKLYFSKVLYFLLGC